MSKLLLVLMLCPFYVFAAPVNINQADAETISDSLSGIGPKKAEAIIKYRQEHGGFKTLKDLEAVSGIGEKTIQANQENILFGDAGSENISPKAEKTP